MHYNRMKERKRKKAVHRMKRGIHQLKDKKKEMCRKDVDV